MKNVYFNHDGNVDDLTSLLLLLQVPDINLIGVGVTDADCFVKPAAEASRKIIDRFNSFNHKLEVALSDSRPKHPFPKEWRLSSYAFNSFPILNEKGKIKTPQAEKPAHLDMIDKIMNQDGKTILIMTGPLSDLARALEIQPEIQNKIEKLYWMGGSLDGHGNVIEPDYDGTAEWNAFWDPEAVKTVWNSNLDIQMVGLESTEELPLNIKLRDHWASLRKYPAMDLIGQGYALVLNYEANSVYYLWDVLTTISSLYPETIKSKKVKSDVIVGGHADGRTYPTENGREITLVTEADETKFYKIMDDLAKSAHFE
ncbi:nucleoside hydrolase [Ligilactobacillus cholophilus]|uniref:nucleoside hydrolase n=1 Tax=Ligilactobacillus cholophilus TaxID=3050131 RepID=UPI0025B17827|nr:nucleoside hydrolase [Ligilactobacillus cholophilus]